LNNYYAYDDGSAEAGFGLKGQGMQNASAAVRFNSFIPDSLRAVDMYFNQVVDSLNLDYYFYLNVWDENNGIPGELLYSQIGERPVYTSSLNKPFRYELDSAIFVQDIFYVGWTKTVDKFSNIGFDLNRNNSANNFYTLGGEWTKSTIPGTIMLRPVLSKTPLKVDNRQNNLPTGSINIYPNPAHSFIHIDLKDQNPTEMSVEIYDLSGRLILHHHSRSDESIYTGDLKNGIYFLRISLHDPAMIFSNKVIIQH